MEKRSRRYWLSFAAGLCLLAGGFGGVLGASTQAAELLMFERQSCAWCIRWEREIAPVYGQTTEGRAAPLRRINVDNGAPSHAEVGSTLKATVIYTPTFVLVENGREIGRITGYGGPEQFWGLLGKMLASRRGAAS
ncbi:MAG: thioredoxin family protein [Bosea sp. (in: a-proteobacteria)]